MPSFTDAAVRFRFAACSDSQRSLFDSLAILLGSIRETPLKGTLLNPTCSSLKGDLIERVYIPQGPPNPNSQILRQDPIPFRSALTYGGCKDGRKRRSLGLGVRIARLFG